MVQFLSYAVLETDRSAENFVHNGFFFFFLCFHFFKYPTIGDPIGKTVQELLYLIIKKKFKKLR